VVGYFLGSLIFYGYICRLGRVVDRLEAYEHHLLEHPPDNAGIAVTDRFINRTPVTKYRFESRSLGTGRGSFSWLLVCLGIVISRMKHPWNLVIETILFSIFVIALFTPVGIDESSKLKFSADLAHMLAFPLGCLSAGVCFTQIIRRPVGTEKVLSDK